MRALCKHLGIKTGFTTAYYPQDNGKVEYKNQKVEQYLHLFCNKRQDNWASHLLAAEFALNSCLHFSASQTPFKIVYGYRPDFTVPVGKQSNMLSLDKCLDRLANVQKEAEVALRLFKERMKKQFKQNKRLAYVFNVGDMVWLTAKDIKIYQKTPKLGP
jgi:transposase InsO family protein